MSLARIAVSGVVRTWDGADRTGVNVAYVRALMAAGGVPLILSPLMGASLAGRRSTAVMDSCLLAGRTSTPPGTGPIRRRF